VRAEQHGTLDRSCCGGCHAGWERIDAGANPGADLFGLSAVLETVLARIIPQAINAKAAPRNGTGTYLAGIEG
jgi:hypothetical protein